MLYASSKRQRHNSLLKNGDSVPLSFGRHSIKIFTYLTYLTHEGSHAPMPSIGLHHKTGFSLTGTARTAGALGKKTALTRSAYSDVISCIIS